MALIELSIERKWTINQTNNETG